MSEWWTYRLSDFLLFAPRTYWRLFELYNADIWPVQIVALALGAAILVLLWRGPAWRGRAIMAILAAAWLWVAFAFHWQRYATINWAATYFAAAFAIEALLLIWVGVVRGKLILRSTLPDVSIAGHERMESRIRSVTSAILLFALVVQPLIGPLLGRAWSGAEVFAVAPDPTSIATLAVLLRAADRLLWELMVVPILWCAITGATLWTMGALDALLAPLAALLVVGLAIARMLARRRQASSAPLGRMP